SARKALRPNGCGDMTASLLSLYALTQLYRHCAPSGELVLIVGSPRSVARYGLPRARATSALASRWVARTEDFASLHLSSVALDFSTDQRSRMEFGGRAC